MNENIKPRRILFCIVLFVSILNSCKKPIEEAPRPDIRSVASTPGQANTPVSTWTPYIIISNTADKTIEQYNYTSTTWNASTAIWIFKPTTALGYSSGAIAALGDGIGDMKLHYTNGFPGKAESAFVVQGGRFLGVGAYIPSGSYVKGQKLWEYTFPIDSNHNNHAVELLPNGNVVVAGYGSSSATSPYGNWIRIYNTADPTGASYAQADIIMPHAIMLDTIYHRLWVGGQILINGLAYHGLFAYIIGGTRTAPTITEDVGMRAVLRYGNPSNPTGTPDHLKWPHDISPDYDNDDILYYGDHTGMYAYNKVTETFTPTPGASHLYTGTDVKVKSVGKMQGTGYYISTQAYNALYPYETNKVDFFDPATGALAFSRTVSGFTIYRAHIWTHVYQ